MDKLVVEQKIESLRKCLLRVEKRCPNSLENLLSDVDAQDVLVLNLSRAVQLCVDISLHILSGRNQPVPETMGQAFTELAAENIINNDLAEKMRKAVGFRNIAIHNYEEINWAIVHAIAKEKLIDFKQFAKQVLSVITAN
ncbi:MAG: DUF86 domain-containing protein [Gammaproteobacteria bacterium]|nr:DUF86 domain-containing protein [Gammaproteobacteria bacterium]